MADQAEANVPLQESDGLASLPVDFDGVFRTGLDRIQSNVVAPLQGRAGEVRCHVWQLLADECHRLLRWSTSIPAPAGWQASWFRALLATLQCGRTRITDTLGMFANRPCEGHADVRETLPLRLGFGNPGSLGCADSTGNTVRWSPLTDKTIGVVAAIDRLQLDAVGLPGARLRANARPPASFPFGLYCRGGPSYYSCAVAYDPGLVHRIREDLGSESRIWMDLDLIEGGSLHWCVCQLPTQGGALKDRDWLAEVEGLDQDLTLLSGPCQGRASRILIVGDINIQPDELDHVVERNRQRMVRWDVLMSKWQLILHNPALHCHDIQEVHLPIRSKHVRIQMGSTRHGPGTGRAIDLVVSTPDVPVVLAIHNGLHCQHVASCSWPVCLEYCRGDHFLQVLSVDLHPVRGREAATPYFPGAWHNVERWHAAFDHASVALRSLLRTVESLVHATTRSLSNRPFLTWGLNVCAWAQTCIAGIARDAWVQLTVGGKRPQCVAGGSTLLQVETCNDRDVGVLAAELMEWQKQHFIPTAVMQKCFQWLRPTLPTPPSRLRGVGRLLEIDESHAAWRSRLQQQCVPGRVFNLEYHRAVLVAYGRMREDVAHHIGSGQRDEDLTQPELVHIVHSLDQSKAMPPDLLPRAAYKAGHELFNRLVWQLQRLAGPGKLASRPQLWRWAVLFTRFKKGDPLLAEAYRLIFIKAQMGLLQESLLTSRIQPDVFHCLWEGQSGFMYGVEEAQCLLLEWCAEALRTGRSLWAVMGDFIKAFPRAWREHLSLLLADRRAITGGCLELLCSIMEEDTVHIWHSGTSSVPIAQGIPEGGTIGTTCYTSIPDVFVRQLLAMGHGVGLPVVVPEMWSGIRWAGMGCPDMTVAWDLAARIKAGQSLPAAEALVGSEVLEASALKAMDLAAPRRLAAIVHCDDPVLLASSRGEMNMILSLLAEWCFDHKAEFHLGDAKTIVMVTSGSQHGVDVLPTGKKVTLPDRPPWTPGTGQALCPRSTHRYFGLKWPASFCFKATLEERLSIACNAFATLPSLLASRAIPLTVALDLFDSKVDNLLAFGRWIFCMVPDAKLRINGQVALWAKALLGGAPFRNTAVAMNELGWHLSGFDRAVLAVAARRAKLWTLPAGNLYGDTFKWAASSGGDSSWATQSARCLSEAGVPDWPRRPPYLGSVAEYVSHVRELLVQASLPAWTELVQTHRSIVPYSVYQATRSSHMHAVKRMALDWSDQLCLLSWCRFRAGYIVLAGRDGRKSAAKLQACLFCSRVIRNWVVHCLSDCTAWSACRSAFKLCRGLGEVLSKDALARLILQCRPGSDGFVLVVRWFDLIDRRSRETLLT